MFTKKRDNQEIENRIKRYSCNLELIKNSEGKLKIKEKISILKEFKDKSLDDISTKITKENSIKNDILPHPKG
jgi:hypothetical protein